MSRIQGAAILLQNLPQAALAGIDLLSFTTTPRFQGIKALPPGLHFVFVSSSTAISIRHGAWFRVEEPQSDDLQLSVKRWSTSDEELVTVTDEADLLRQKANLGSVWKEGLTPYRQSATAAASTNAEHEAAEAVLADDWDELTDRISEAVLNRIVGTDAHWTLTSASSAARDLDEIPGLKNEGFAHKDLVLKLLPVELKYTWRPGATGRERTDAARDHSWALGELVDEHCGGDAMQIIGELQFCLLMVLTINNFSCLEQWKRLLQLLFTCLSAVTERPNLYIQALQLLRLQLKRSEDAEGGLFDLSEDGAGFLKKLLRRFRKSLSEVDGKGKADVVDELDELEGYLKANHGWDMDDNFLKTGMVTLADGEQVEMTLHGYDEEDESGEYAPTVVELSEEQLAELSGPPRSNLQIRSRRQQSPEMSEDDEEEADLEDMDARY